MHPKIANTSLAGLPILNPELGLPNKSRPLPGNIPVNDKFRFLRKIKQIGA
jgi:hypothetical protein